MARIVGLFGFCWICAALIGAGCEANPGGPSAPRACSTHVDCRGEGACLDGVCRVECERATDCPDPSYVCWGYRCVQADTGGSAGADVIVTPPDAADDVAHPTDLPGRDATDATDDVARPSDTPADQTTGDVPEAPLCGSEPPVPVIRCDQGEEVVPQTMLVLNSDASHAAGCRVHLHEWRVEQPVGSQSVFIPSNTFPNPRFEANVAGTYVFWLDVWDENRTKSAAPARYEVQVIGDSAFHIELLWTTPDDPDETDEGPYAGSDLDLHFMHPLAMDDPSMPDIDGDGRPDPYFHPVYDCYWYNPRPSWGRQTGEGSADHDPRVDRDDTDGAGPENISLRVPQDDAEYRVAVHYWDDHGFGAALATVRIYVFDNLRWEIADTRLDNRDLWCAAFIDWPSGSVRACAAPDGGPHITPNYAPPAFLGR